MRCEPTLVIGSSAALWMGIPAAEVQSVMQLCRVPRRRQLEVFDGVKQMGAAWAAVKNEKH